MLSLTKNYEDILLLFEANGHYRLAGLLQYLFQDLR